MSLEEPQGRFVDDDGEAWYRIDRSDRLLPFFVALASDSDVWAFVSTAGSLAAGRRDAEGSFFPYETVDRIHRRWEHTGPRTWIRIADGQGGVRLWLPFAPRVLQPVGGGERSVWKNVAGTRLRLREASPCGALVFEQEWSSAAGLGLVRRARLWSSSGAPCAVQVLDGVLDLVPPGVSVLHAATMSSLTDAYKWNESHAAGRLGLFTLYSRVSDRAEPAESFEALVAWRQGPARAGGDDAEPIAAVTLLSDAQVEPFCRDGRVEAETLTRGRKGAFLVAFDAEVDAAGLQWHQVLDGPLSQAQAHDLAVRLAANDGTAAQIAQQVAANTAGLNALLAGADAHQQSADPMAAVHHHANVLFNVMRGGVFVDGTRVRRDDVLASLRRRHRALAERLAPVLASWPETLERDEAVAAARAAAGAQGERLLLSFLPLTFSRRHGDPSRPWNRFSIRVRDAAGRRLLHHEGNWRDIFQNWEALAASAPGWLGSMIATFLGAMTPDGHNPYRIGSDGVDWEVVDPHDPWSHIGYWGDHQVVYLLRLLEAAQANEPTLLTAWWDRPLFAFADVPYRLKPYAEQVADPKHTIRFDDEAHAAAKQRAAAIGSDGLLVCGDDGLPVLATLAEKLATIVLAKAGTLVPGGGLWLNTQRPEWNDANNALVGNGLSVVTLAHLRRFLAFIAALPGAGRPFAAPAALVDALQRLQALAAGTPAAAVHDPAARRRFVDAAGALLGDWRGRAYRGAAGRDPAEAPPGLLPALAAALLPLVDATLAAQRRDDGLYHAYNLMRFDDHGIAVEPLYPMLEGQVAVLASAGLPLAERVALLDALFASALYDPARRSFTLYPDRELPGFLERNRLDAEALALPAVQAALAQGRTDLLQTQSDGTVRFAPGLANRRALEDALARGAPPGADTHPLLDAYERLLGHHAFTGRSGTMFAYEGLGCIYWHMVAKLLLAVQESVFDAVDAGAAELTALIAHYRAVRDGLGYRKRVAEYGAFPFDPYSHTPAEGGAQQPGMTGQVKEEILARWGELGVRVQGGRIRFCPVLTDPAEVPPGGALAFTFRGVPWCIRLGVHMALRVQRADGWHEASGLEFDPAGVTAVEAWIAPDRTGTAPRGAPRATS
jgi:hypothetical protein